YMKRYSLKYTMATLVFLLILIFTYLYTAKSMNAFNSQKFSQADFIYIQEDLTNQYILYKESIKKKSSTQITIKFHNIIPPNTSNIEIYSHKISNYLYIGPYEPTLSFPIDNILFEDNGSDSLVISIVDKEDRISHTIEQEKTSEFWKKDRTTHLWFLPFRTYDEETGKSIGYTVSLS
ncbi:hypothetical protein ACTXJF_11095, partial [Psychrobacter alimentarius]|uniref:hypothetical protein n=1 Tax=Psychrobacter alimentarius TaxID=261164 RepID=UPI003FD11039